MRLVCMHADMVDALKRLSIEFDDLTPSGLWSSQYHLVGLTPEQMEALEVFRVEVEDVTPAQLAQAEGAEVRSDARGAAAAARALSAAATSAPTHGALAGAMAVPQAAHELATAAPAAGSSEQGGREPGRAATGTESEVPLAQTRDAGVRATEGKAESRPDAKPATQGAPGGAPAGGAPATTGPQQPSGQKTVGAKGGGTASGQAGRKGQPQPSAQGGGQRYGTTRLRISVAGKYTEATVANGKIVVAGRTFDSPDQAAAELTKSRGDWTFWEYYDSTDGKWRMLTRDWDTVLKSAAPGGR
jgi:hypothetical protein